MTQTAEWSNLRVVLKSARRFDQEVEILKRVHDYDYIIPFYGVTIDPLTNTRYMVMKYCSNGNLTSFLRNHHEDLTWLERYRICIDVAKGLEFLHKSGVYHQNLHSGNILLDDKRTAMLCDFGLSRSSSSDQTTELVAPIGVASFLAPERFLIQTPAYTAACDIYSLGETFWHISSGRIPFASRLQDPTLLRELMDGLREVIVPGTPREFQDLIVKCWDAQSSRRLKIRVVIAILQTLIARPSEPVRWLSVVPARLSELALTAHPVPSDLDSKMENLERAPNKLNRMVFDSHDPVMKETVDYIERTRAYFRDSGSPQEPYSPSNLPKIPIYLCLILGDIAALRYYLSQGGSYCKSIN
ncbi:MAG: kinase-like domain-containing protein, partial [Benniella sp.]